MLPRDIQNRVSQVMRSMADIMQNFMAYQIYIIHLQQKLVDAEENINNLMLETGFMPEENLYKALEEYHNSMLKTLQLQSEGCSDALSAAAKVWKRATDCHRQIKNQGQLQTFITCANGCLVTIVKVIDAVNLLKRAWKRFFIQDIELIHPTDNEVLKDFRMECNKLSNEVREKLTVIDFEVHSTRQKIIDIKKPAIRILEVQQLDNDPEDIMIVESLLELERRGGQFGDEKLPPHKRIKRPAPGRSVQPCTSRQSLESPDIGESSGPQVSSTTSGQTETHPSESPGLKTEPIVKIPKISPKPVVQKNISLNPPTSTQASSANSTPTPQNNPQYTHQDIVTQPTVGSTPVTSSLIMNSSYQNLAPSGTTASYLQGAQNAGILPGMPLDIQQQLQNQGLAAQTGLHQIQTLQQTGLQQLQSPQQVTSSLQTGLQQLQGLQQTGMAQGLQQFQAPGLQTFQSLQSPQSQQGYHGLQNPQVLHNQTGLQQFQTQSFQTQSLQQQTGLQQNATLSQLGMNSMQGVQPQLIPTIQVDAFGNQSIVYQLIQPTVTYQQMTVDGVPTLVPVSGGTSSMGAPQMQQISNIAAPSTSMISQESNHMTSQMENEHETEPEVKVKQEKPDILQMDFEEEVRVKEEPIDE